MNTTKQVHDGKLAHVDAAVTKEVVATKAPPRLDPDRLLQRQAQLVGAVKAGASAAESAHKRELSTLFSVFGVLLVKAFAAFEAAYLSWTESASSTQVWATGTSDVSRGAYEFAAALRQLIVDRFTLATEAETEVRRRLGVGSEVRPENPVAVKGLLALQLSAVSDPALVEFLCERGVLVDAMRDELTVHYEALSRRMAAGPGLTRGSAREKRDEAQVRVEVLLSRGAGLFLASGGPSAMAAFEALWPRNASGKRANDPAPDDPGSPLVIAPVVAGPVVSVPVVSEPVVSEPVELLARPAA